MLDIHQKIGGGHSPPFSIPIFKVSDIDRPSKNRLKRRFEARFFRGFAKLGNMLSGMVFRKVLTGNLAWAYYLNCKVCLFIPKIMKFGIRPAGHGGGNIKIGLYMQQ